MWSNKAQIMSDVSVAGTELFSSAVVLEDEEVAHVQVKADFPGTPTDDLTVSVYGTLDESSENWDTKYHAQYTIEKEIDPNSFSIVVKDLRKFRIGCVRSGSTDTITVNAYYRKSKSRSV